MKTGIFKLQEEPGYYSIQTVKSKCPGKYDYHKLRREAAKQGLEPKYTMTAAHQMVYAYHKDVWKICYPEVKLDD